LRIEPEFVPEGLGENRVIATLEEIYPIPSPIPLCLRQRSLRPTAGLGGFSIVSQPCLLTLDDMFRSLQLLISPGSTWAKIAAAKRGVVWILLIELLPLLLITCAIEGYILTRWGERADQFGRVISHPLKSAVTVECIQLAVSLAMVLAAAQILSWVGESFHFYPRFRVCFTLTTFGFSPYLLLRLLHYAPGLNEWVGPALGALGCIYVLYQGVGVVLEPDQTQGFGLFLLSVLTFTLFCGMHQLIVLKIVQGKLPV
jgi:hypothetical protein